MESEQSKSPTTSSTNQFVNLGGEATSVEKTNSQMLLDESIETETFKLNNLFERIFKITINNKYAHQNGNQQYLVYIGENEDDQLNRYLSKDNLDEVWPNKKFIVP